MLRVGFISSKVFTDAGYIDARIVAGVLAAARAHALFEPRCYVLRPRSSGAPRWPRVTAHCASVTDLGHPANLSAEEAAAAIRADGVHAVVDLDGPSARLPVALHAILARLGEAKAVLRVAAVGFLGPQDARVVDYTAGDALTVPDAALPFYRIGGGGGGVLRLPPPVWPCPRRASGFDDDGGTRDAILPAGGSDRAARRARLFGDGDAFVFAAFNPPHKLHPRLFRAWMRVLSRTAPGGARPPSKLWLFFSAGSRSAEHAAFARLRGAAAALGVDPTRLVHASTIPRAAHARRLPLADLALDSAPCNGGGTTCDLLAAGVPVVSLGPAAFGAGGENRGMYSGLGASLLSAAGLGSLVAGSWEEYEDLAVALAARSNKLRLAAIRHSLLQAPLLPVFDTERWTRQFAVGLRATWRRHAAGLPAAGVIDVAEEGGEIERLVDG